MVAHPHDYYIIFSEPARSIYNNDKTTTLHVTNDKKVAIEYLLAGSNVFSFPTFERMDKASIEWKEFEIETTLGQNG